MDVQCRDGNGKKKLAYCGGLAACNVRTRRPGRSR